MALIILYTGHCVTTAYPGEVCGLNSYAVSCNRNGLSATACRCYQDENDIVPTENETSLNDFNTTTSDALNDTSQSHDEASGIHIQITEPSTQSTLYDIASNIDNSTCEGIIT